MPSEISDDSLQDMKKEVDLGDEEAFESVYADVLPKVIQAARRKFGERIRWYSPEDAASSAVRTVYRRLKEQKLQELQSWKDLEDLLVTVAFRKYVNKSRRASVESRARERIALDPLAPDRSQAEAPDSLASEESRAEALDCLELLNDVPQDDVERLVLCGKLDGDTEQTIADRLAKKTCEPWSKYMVRRIWEKIRMQFLQRAANRFGSIQLDE
jgi:DNA-directed RNA polymerase specialized sigma24 family protein